MLWFIISYTLAWLAAPARNFNVFWTVHFFSHVLFYSFIIPRVEISLMTSFLMDFYHQSLSFVWDLSFFVTVTDICVPYTPTEFL